MRWLLLFFLLPALAAASPLRLDASARTVNLTPFVTALADEGGALRFSQVAALPQSAFAPVAGMGSEINFGYRRAAYWLRFVLRTDEDGLWLLETGYPTLDEVEVHAGRQSWRTGDRLPFAERPLPHRNFVFPLHLTANEETTVFVRVASQGNLTVPLHLWTPSAFVTASRNTYVTLSLYYGSLLALMLYNLLLYFSLRDANHLAYVLFVAAMAVAQLSANGLGNEYLWPDWPLFGHLAFPVGFAATGLFGAIFTRRFLRTAEHAPLFDRFIIGLAAAFALSITVIVFISYRLGSIMTSFTGIGFAAVAVLAGLRCLQRGQPGARWFLLAWGLLLLGTAILGLRNLGWLPTNPFTIHAMQIASALEMLLLSFALADRINTLRREKEQAQSDVLAANIEKLALLRDSEKQLEARVAERTRQLEQANIELATHSNALQHQAHHDPLTGLANRVLLDLRLEHALQGCRRSSRGLAVLLVDLDDFKPVNDNYGHAVGDEVLCAVAERLRAATRGTDTVARLGGDEFVVVLENLHQETEAHQVAAKLTEVLGAELPLTSVTLHIGASIGLACYPGDGTTARELLHAADASMYRCKQQRHSLRPTALDPQSSAAA